MHNSYSPRHSELDRYIILAVPFSLILHLLLAFFLSPSTTVQSVLPITVDIVMAPPKRIEPIKKQIVESPKEIEKTEIPPTKIKSVLQSERDTFAKREQVKRGDSGGVPGKAAKVSEPRKAAPKAVERPARSSSATSGLKLKLDSATVLRDVAEDSSTKERQSNLSDYRPFSRAFGTGAAFLGNAGTRDYLPNLPDGDITLLNTKANRFAVFVRRVASQVFGQIRTQGWDSLRFSDIRSISQYGTVYATLSPEGKLIDVKVDSRSGSANFDEVLLKAVRAGARDSNPPKEAATDDGNFRFIFKAKSWAQVWSDPRSGFPGERRWIMLATGLE